MFGIKEYGNHYNMELSAINSCGCQISSYSPTYYIGFFIHSLLREFWRVLTETPTTYGLESIPPCPCSRKLKNLSELAMSTFVECKNLEGLQKMLKDLVAFYDRATKLQADMSKKIISEYFAGNIVVLEKQLLTSMKIINGLDEDQLRQIDKTVNIAYSTNKTLERLMSDVDLLLRYLDSGNKISKAWIFRPFFPSVIKRALYVTNDILVNGNPCTSKKALKLVGQDLKLKRRFRKLSKIWDSEPPLGSSYRDTYNFFKNTILKAIDLITVIDDAENTRLEIQKTSNLLLRPFEEKCRIQIGGKKIRLSTEMDNFKEYSFQEIIHDYSDNILNMEKE